MNSYEDFAANDIGFDLPEHAKPRVDFTSLNAMSADDPSFPGFGPHRSGADDVFTSPIFTDPSPALTDNNSFDVESCDPSPLVGDDLEAPQGEYAHVPLFNDMTLFSPVQGFQHSFGDQQHQQHGASVATDGTVQASTSAPPADFTLFPDVQRPSSSPPRAQMAFAEAAEEDPTTMLLRALQGIAANRSSQGPVVSASPTLISSPPKQVAGTANIFPNESPLESRRPPLQHSATAPSLTTGNDVSESSVAADADAVASSECRRGSKKRLRAEDLLPLDAPIQSRNYLGPSATSRKDWVPPSSIDNGPSAEDLAAINAESNPLKAKRLSNTLAARRSRHRKAQERVEYQEKIAQLEAESAQWKKRCERAEQERDELAQKLKHCQGK